MDFARDISNRVFYIDDYGIYEEGTPKEIFSNPKKPKTQSFIFNIQSYTFEVNSTHFDYAEMLGGLENFCFRHAIPRKTANKLQLLAEELMINILVLKYPECKLHITYSEKLATYQLSVSYYGEPENVIDNATDDLSAMMIKNLVKDIKHQYVEGKNVLSLRIGSEG